MQSKQLIRCSQSTIQRGCVTRHRPEKGFIRSAHFQYYTLDCYPGEICSQTIPIEADADPEVGRPSLVTHSDPDFGNSNEIDDDDDDRRQGPML